MSEWLLNNFKGAGFMPHGYCFLWNPQLIGLHLFSDILITVAYFSIPAALLYFVRKRTDLPFPWIFWLFGAFIMLCGLTHLLGVWTLWNPHYWSQGIVKLMTGLVSIATAVAMVPLIPKLLALPLFSGGTQQAQETLDQLRAALAQEIEKRNQVEEVLRQTQEVLTQQGLGR